MLVSHVSLKEEIILVTIFRTSGKVTLHKTILKIISKMGGRMDNWICFNYFMISAIKEGKIKTTEKRHKVVRRLEKEGKTYREDRNSWSLSPFLVLSFLKTSSYSSLPLTAPFPSISISKPQSLDGSSQFMLYLSLS